MNFSAKQLAIAGLAVIGAFAAWAYMRGAGGVVGALVGGDRDLAIKRYLAGPKAVAESAKVAKLGADAYRDKIASESMVKS